jgi:trehalose 6-phosphate phosphatase
MRSSDGQRDGRTGQGAAAQRKNAESAGCSTRAFTEAGQTLPGDGVPDFAGDWALFLDVDGTLLEFAGHPREVEVPPGLITILSDLARKVPLALISGRPIVDLDCLFVPLKLPMAGQHGGERRAATGQVTRKDRLAPLSVARGKLAEFVADHPGLLLEDKGLTLALHYRRAQHLKPLVEAVMGLMMREVGREFILLAGNRVYEIRPSGANKGLAIAAFMEELPFMGRVPVFIGDDVTDEEGFVAVNRLGGLSIKVGEGDTAARWRLPNAAAVREWLSDYRRWLDNETAGLTK